MTDNFSNNQRDDLDLRATVAEFIDGLPERSEDILVKRYGLQGDKKMTLEQVGQNYNITRERVRQIESATLRDLLASEKVKHLEPAEDLIVTVLEDYGQVMEHNALVEKALEKTSDETHGNHIEFVLHVSGKFYDQKEDDYYKKAWYIKDADLSIPKKVVDSFIEILEEKNEPVPHEEIHGYIKNHDVANEIAEHIDDSDRIIAFLRLGKRIQKNPYSEWGMAHWNEIMPRGVKDKAYVVLKKEARPLHFTEITEKINSNAFGSKIAVPQTVHNELIKDERFVLVGRGIYALVAWGYKPGTVADVVADVLKETEKPLSKEDIVEEVLKQRLVKKNTIVLALQNTDKIKREGETYLLIEDK
ncbi:hypothetical protein KKC60_05580 [Patescibacteria group bacterium]|nr:hypothetical protein [Patescibacteria group bacterium]